MRGQTTPLLAISALICVSVTARAVVAQPVNQAPSDQVIALGKRNGDCNSPLNYLTNITTAEPRQAAAVCRGMDQLAKIMQRNGGDPQRAMLEFVQSPEGHAVMGVPGAFEKLVEDFNEVIALPSSQQPKTTKP
jgi:hypothetical protein